MRTRYKVGDRIKVRKDLNSFEEYEMFHNHETDCIVTSMLKYRGKTVTIEECCNYGYRIKEDGNTWNWTDEMFEELDNRKTLEQINSALNGKTNLFWDDKWVI